MEADNKKVILRICVLYCPMYCPSLQGKLELEFSLDYLFFLQKYSNSEFSYYVIISSFFSIFNYTSTLKRQAQNSRHGKKIKALHTFSKKKHLFLSSFLSFEEDFSHGSPILNCLRFHGFPPSLYCLCVCIFNQYSMLCLCRDGK